MSTNERPQEPGSAAIVAQVKKTTGQIARALPNGMDAGRFVRIAMTALRVNPKLAACEPRTIITSIVQAAQFGLTINDGLGLAYLIPRKRKGWAREECTLQVGYKGLRVLARRADKERVVFGRVVYANDKFRLSYAPPAIEHEPTLTGKTGEPIGAYAASYRDGKLEAVRWCHLGEIDAAMARSPGADAGGPWKTDWPAMAAKTPLRRLLMGDLDLSADDMLARAVVVDDAAENDLEIPLDPSCYEVGDAETPKPAPKPAEIGGAPGIVEEEIRFGRQKEGKA